MIYSKQCLLVQEDGIRCTAWLPEKFAKLRKCITLEGSEGNWYVIEVYNETRMPSEYVEERSRDFKNTRKASDV